MGTSPRGSAPIPPSGSMRGTALALPLTCLALLALARRGQGEGSTVRLCGRDFVRAVVFTCGGSRWRRDWSGHPERPASRFSATENENPQAFPPDGDTDSSPYTALGTYSKDTHGAEPEPQQGSAHGSRKSVLSKREAAELLTTSCCNVGCSRREISSLC